MAQTQDVAVVRHPTVEIATAAEVTVHLLGGTVIEGMSSSREITRRGFVLQATGESAQAVCLSSDIALKGRCFATCTDIVQR